MTDQNAELLELMLTPEENDGFARQAAYAGMEPGAYAHYLLRNAALRPVPDIPEYPEALYAKAVECVRAMENPTATALIVAVRCNSIVGLSLLERMEREGVVSHLDWDDRRHVLPVGRGGTTA